MPQPRRSPHSAPLRALTPIPKLGSGTIRGIGRTTLAEPPIRSFGPRIYHLQQIPKRSGGPGPPPEGFLTGRNSVTEWVIYWALAKVLGDPPDPRKPPFVGGISWQYQVPDVGGRMPGGQVLDFIVYPRLSVASGTTELGDQSIGIRLETQYFHTFADPITQARDTYLSEHAMVVDKIIRMWDETFIYDESGQAAVRAVRDAIRGREWANPIRTGNAQRTPSRLTPARTSL